MGWDPMNTPSPTTLRAANLDVYKGDTLVDNMLPARSFYPTQPEPLTEVAIHRTVREDLYLVLASENQGPCSRASASA